MQMFPELDSDKCTALHAAESGVLGSGIKRKRSAGKTQGWWKQPWHLDSLLLDTAALLTALETGYGPDRTLDQERIVLSLNCELGSFADITRCHP